MTGKSVVQQIREAVAEERERCAQIADSGDNRMNGLAKAGMARAIARRIRVNPLMPIYGATEDPDVCGYRLPDGE